MSLRALAGNAAWSTLSHLLGRGSLVVAAILLARQLDTKSFAAYSYFQLTVSMLAAYAAMGLGVTASRFFAESGHVDDAQLPPIGTLWILSILAGLLAAVVVVLLPADWLTGGLGVPRWMLALGLFSMVLGVVPGGGILGLERYAEATLAAAASAVVLVFGAVVAGSNGSPIAAMAVLVAATLIQSLGNAFIVVRQTGCATLARHSRMGWKELKRVTGFAGPMLGVSLLSASGAWIVGRMILEETEGEREFSLYAIGLQWYALALFIPGMVSRVVLPRLVRSRAGKVDSDSGLLVHRASLASLVAASSVSLLGLIASPWILKLYGAEYSVDTWLLGAFLLAAIPSAPVNVVGNAIVAADGQRAWLLLTMVWFAVLMLSSSMLANRGAFGGAAALFISSLILGVLAVSLARARRVV